MNDQRDGADQPNQPVNRGAHWPAGVPNDTRVDLKIIADRVEEDAEVSELVGRRLEAGADRELTAGTVTLRWGREQIAVVKRAAALMGVPNQTYLKQVLFRQALDDIQRAETALARSMRRFARLTRRSRRSTMRALV